MSRIKFDRVSEKKEIAQLSEMANEIWHEYFTSIISTEQINYMVEMFLSVDSIIKEIQEGYEFYFERDGEKTIGFMVVRPEEKRLFISKLYIHNDYRGQGYGSFMFDNAIKIAVSYGLSTMYLTVNKENQNSIDVYKHKGFEIIEEVKNDIGNGFFMDDYIFEKEIAKAEIAKTNFELGYNCSQSVVLAFEDELNMSRRQLAQIASSFGGGIGRLREVCGAVSGMALVLGMTQGYSEPKDYEGKKEQYAIVQNMAKKFEDINGTIICRELLGITNKKDDFVPEIRTAEYYQKRPCGDLVAHAAQIAFEILKGNGGKV